MKLDGDIDKIRDQIFRRKATVRKIPFVLKMKELEDTVDFIDESKWIVKKE